MADARIERLENRRLYSVLQPDVTWGSNGYLTPALEPQTLLATTADGILAFGFFTTPSGTMPDGQTVQRFTIDGLLDPTYHIVHPPVSTYSDTPAAADSRGRAYAVTGNGLGRTTLTRYTTRGDVDPTFGTNGVVDLPVVEGDRGTNLVRVLLTADGSVYPTIAYETNVYDGDEPQATHTTIFKFSDTGVPDPAFGDNGLIDHSDTSFPDVIWTGVTADEKILRAEGGQYKNETTVTRLNPDGTLDRTFASAGSLNLKVDTQSALNFALDAQGRLLIADTKAIRDGLFDDAGFSHEVRRFTPSGRPDLTFGDAGIYALPQDITHYITRLRVFAQPDGKTVAELGDRIVRLMPDGKIDPTFDPDGTAEVAYPNGDLIGLLPDGSLLSDASPRADFYNANIARLAPFATVAMGQDGTLHLNGDDGANSFRVYPSGTKNSIALDIDGTRYGTFTGVTAVVAELGDGNDIYLDEAFTDAGVPQTINGDGGNDRITTGGGDDSVNAGDGDDTLATGGGYDAVELGDGSDVLDAGSGGGDIHATTGFEGAHNFVRGRGGNWTVYIPYGSAVVDLTGDTANVTCYGEEGSTVLLDTTHASHVITSSGNDSITTGRGNDLIEAGNGDDTVSTGAGDDVINEPLFDDFIPDTDNDTYDLGPGNDRAIDGYGDNTIVGGDGDDSIRTAGGNDVIDGALGRDTLRGGAGDDTLTGGGGRDRVFGQDGDDLLGGGGNNDTLVGGLGNDLLFDAAGDDLLIAGTPNGPHIDTAENRLGGGDGIDRYQIESTLDLFDRVESPLDVVT